MTSQIATNMGAVRAHNVFARNNANMATALDRVTTGLKINSAKDGTSQYAISEKMRERINSNNQVSQNVQNDNALTRTAAAGLDNTANILKTLKARALNAADDTNTDENRKTIQKEIDQLLKQIDDNATGVKYNGKTLLDGTYDGERVSNATKAAYGSKTKIFLDKDKDLTDASTLGLVSSSAQTATLIVSWATNGEFHKDESITSLAAKSTIAEVISSASNIFTGGSIATVDEAANITLNENNASNVSSSKAYYAVGTSTGKEANFSDLTIKIVSNADPSKYLEYKFDQSVQEAKDQNTKPDTLSFQIGEEQGMSLQLAVSDMSALGIGISKLDVSTKEKADYSIKAIDAALDKVLGQQAELGALEQRLGYTADALDTINENLQAADSAVRDSDIAKEISNYMKWNVLSQASQYMLAQSNQNAYGVLNLLQ